MRAAIVTGSSRGIGAAVLKGLAKDGLAVVVNYVNGPEDADAVAREVRAAGGLAITVQADVSQEADVKRLFEETKRAFTTVDVVVHNAGIMPLSPLAETDIEMFDKVMLTNLRSTFLIFSEVARHIADGGRVIGFSSSVVAKAFPGYGAYIASKAGTEGLVHVLANELAGRQVTVNAVAPGPVNTSLFTKGKSQEQIDEAKKSNPMGRLGEPEDIARVVSFLAGSDGAWVNSQVLRVNGGFVF